jgi:hypothetical protein
MTVEAAIFRCSICGEPSTEICVYCTKDACGNHRCERCKRCSDCCECDVPLSAEEHHEEYPESVDSGVLTEPEQPVTPAPPEQPTPTDVWPPDETPIL